jgi:hypothetical protein
VVVRGRPHRLPAAYHRDGEERERQEAQRVAEQFEQPPGVDGMGHRPDERGDGDSSGRALRKGAGNALF